MKKIKVNKKLIASIFVALPWIPFFLTILAFFWPLFAFILAGNVAEYDEKDFWIPTASGIFANVAYLICMYIIFVGV